jgi:hypothetical protein
MPAPSDDYANTVAVSLGDYRGDDFELEVLHAF